jgi:hypothetical protein
LAESVEEFAYSRMAKNEIPTALELIQKSEAAGLGRAWRRAENLIALGVERELGALEAIGDNSTGSEASRRLLADTGAQWKQYGQGLEMLLRKSAELRARRLKQSLPSPLPRTALEKKYSTLVPSLTENVKGQEFRVEGSPSYRNYIKIHPEALKDLGLEFFERRAILDYINGRRSVTAIRDRAESETSIDIPLEKVVRYLDLLKSIGWITYRLTERP